MKIKTLLVVLLAALALFLWFRLVRLPDAETWRDLRGAFATYRVYHNGLMPRDIDELINFVRQQEGASAEPSNYRRWKKFIYVANLFTNDSSSAPVIIESPSGFKWQKGLVGLYGGGSLSLPSEGLSRLAKEPWLFIRNEFKDESTFNDFTQRVRVVYP